MGSFLATASANMHFLFHCEKKKFKQGETYKGSPKWGYSSLPASPAPGPPPSSPPPPPTPPHPGLILVVLTGANLATSGEIFDVPAGGCGTAGIQSVEARDAVRHPTMHRTPLHLAPKR